MQQTIGVDAPVGYLAMAGFRVLLQLLHHGLMETLQPPDESQGDLLILQGAGGGLQRCRAPLADHVSEAEA